MTMGYSVVDTTQIQVAHTDGEQVVRFRLYSFEQAFVDHVKQVGYMLNCSRGVMVPLDDAGAAQADQALQLDRQSTLYSVVCN